MSSTISTVRVAGTSEGFCQELMQTIGTYLGQQQQSDNNQADEVSAMQTLQISNRYFDAQVQLSPLQIIENDNPEAPNRKEDGILLVFEEDASQNNFDQLAALHAQAESTQQNGDLLRLCISLKTKTISAISLSEKERETEYSRRVLWCLDRGYEYVPDVDLEAPEMGHEEREKEGFARIIEALQGTVWSAAVMKPRQQQALQQNYRQDASKLITGSSLSEKENEIDNSHDAYEPPPTTLPLATTSVSEETDAPLFQESEQEFKEREEKARRALLSQGDETKSNHNNANPTGHDDEHLMNQFESAIQEAKSIREMSRNGSLSDEQRKQRAGDAATLIMNLMNQMGGLDDDDSDENEEEEDSDA